MSTMHNAQCTVHSNVELLMLSLSAVDAAQCTLQYRSLHSVSCTLPTAMCMMMITVGVLALFLMIPLVNGYIASRNMVSVHIRAIRT